MITKQQREEWRWRYRLDRPFDYSANPREVINKLLDALDEQDKFHQPTDTERLDWLNEYRLDLFSYRPLWKCDDLRTAIDKAMEEK